MSRQTNVSTPTPPSRHDPANSYLPSAARNPAKLTLADAVAESRRLTPRDRTVLHLLGAHHVLTADQLGRLVFPNSHRARHRLLLLHQRGVLTRFRDAAVTGSLPWRYTLGLLGAALHAADTGAPLPRPSDVHARVLRLAASRTLDHLLGVNEFFAQLAHHARTHPATGLTQWWPEQQIAQTCGGIVRPDAYGEWTEAHHTVGFFLEYDTGTETITTLTEKIRKYQELAAEGISRPVLFHLPTTARETHLHAAVARTRPTGLPPVLVATTTADLLGAGFTPADRIWTRLTPGRGDLGHVDPVAPRGVHPRRDDRRPPWRHRLTELAAPPTATATHDTWELLND